MTAFRAILLPIKDLTNAKQRLAGVLTQDERFALANAMLEDTMCAIAEASLARAIFVVTSYGPAIAAAEARGWHVLREPSQISESASVDFASRLCAERSVTHLLRVPLDVPLVRGEDLDELLAVDAGERGAVIVPSRDGTGTNAILRTPPSLFPSHFGPGSFALHRAEARAAGTNWIVRRNARIEMDIDDESDLRAFLACSHAGTRTGEVLKSLGAAQRLEGRGERMTGGRETARAASAGSPADRQ